MASSQSEKLTWKQETAHHFIALAGGRRIDVQYESAGFQSGWAVYTGNHLISRCAEFMQAKGVAMKAALEQTTQRQLSH